VSKQKQKGTSFESAAAEWLTERLGTEVRRNVLMAQLDQGDLYGVFIDGKPLVIECKNEREYKLSEWMGELEREMENSDTDVGIVLFHRRGIGLPNMGKQYVLTDLETFTRIMRGGTDD